MLQRPISRVVVWDVHVVQRKSEEKVKKTVCGSIMASASVSNKKVVCVFDLLFSPLQNVCVHLLHHEKFITLTKTKRKQGNARVPPLFVTSPQPFHILIFFFLSLLKAWHGPAKH
jgi:hypothetical protein